MSKIEELERAVSEIMREELKKYIGQHELQESAVEEVVRKHLGDFMTAHPELLSPEEFTIVELGLQLQFGMGSAKALECALKVAELPTILSLYDRFGGVIPLLQYEYLVRTDRLTAWTVDVDQASPDGWGRDLDLTVVPKTPLNYVKYSIDIAAVQEKKQRRYEAARETVITEAITIAALMQFVQDFEREPLCVSTGAYFLLATSSGPVEIPVKHYERQEGTLCTFVHAFTAEAGKGTGFLYEGSVYSVSLALRDSHHDTILMSMPVGWDVTKEDSLCFEMSVGFAEDQ